MKLTKKQQKDLVSIRFFIPPWVDWGKTVYPCGAVEDSDGDDPVEVFFDWSDKGIQVKGRRVNGLAELEALLQGKRWRGIHIHELYEKSIAEGTATYFEILQGVPKEVAEFLSKEMFNGTDESIIMRAFENTK